MVDYFSTDLTSFYTVLVGASLVFVSLDIKGKGYFVIDLDFNVAEFLKPFVCIVNFGF